MWGQRLPKVLKLSKLQNVPKLPKLPKNVQSLKITKTALSGLANKAPVKECVRVFCECCWWYTAKTRPRQAQEPCPAFSSFPQLIPARPGPRSLVQLPRGSGRVPSVQGASQRSYKAQESFSVPRDVPRWSPALALRNCAQEWKPCVFMHLKNSKLNILFLVFDI